MCMLNGTLGGSLFASIDFGQIETYQSIYEPVDINSDNYLTIYEANKYYYEHNNQMILSKDEYVEGRTYLTKLDTSSLKDLTLKHIIREAVHTYAKEPYQNIIINDLDQSGLELLEYRGDKPLYFFFSAGMIDTIDDELEKVISYISQEIRDRKKGGDDTYLWRNNLEWIAMYAPFFNINKYENIIPYKSLMEDLLIELEQSRQLQKNDFDGSICENMTYNDEKLFYSSRWLGHDNPSGIKKLKDIDDSELNNLVNGFNNYATPVQMVDSDGIKSDKYYTVAKVQYGQTAGYRQTDLIYTGELISSVGETLTSILDKIKNMLGDFEYFYDIDGRFIFQRKKTYVNTNWNTLVETSDKDVYAENAAYTSDIQYSFEDNNLITSFANTAQLNNLKNDFSVWGVRKGITGGDIPIHARFAIDKKPNFYQNFNGQYYVSDNSYAEELKTKKIQTVDWREIIYQMALDYFAHNQEDDFLVKIKDNNYIGGEYLFPSGYTGYEQYYTDLQGFWRTLYDIEPKVVRESIGGKYEDVKIVLDPVEGTYKIEKQWVEYKEVTTDFTCDYYLPTSYKTKEYYQCSDENADKHFIDHLAYWNKNVVLAPETLNFWFEFLDNAGELEQHSVCYIGDRAKSINDSKVSAIYFRETPNIIFTSKKDYNLYDINTGYVYIWLQPYIENSFVISAQGKSAKEKIDELLYNYTYCMENINLSTIPIYYLEPNARIYVYDEESNINGDYIVNKLSIPLTYNGTMSINAVKAVERLL